MSMNVTAKIAFSLVAAITIVLAALGIILLTYNRPIRASKDNCSVEVKKCNEPTDLYHIESGRCIRIGDSTPELCGYNMVMSPVPACPLQGQCECDYEVDKQHLVYHDDTRQCYFIDSPGPCKDGKVVAVSFNGTRLSCKQHPHESGSAEHKVSKNFGASRGLGRFLPGKCKPGSYQTFKGQCVPVPKISFTVYDPNNLEPDED